MDWATISTVPAKPITAADIMAAVEKARPIAAKIREADEQIARELSKIVGEPVDNVRVDAYDPEAGTATITYTVKRPESFGETLQRLQETAGLRQDVFDDIFGGKTS
jgi:hypothetical protein